jgi:hypothetical protein
VILQKVEVAFFVSVLIGDFWQALQYIDHAIVEVSLQGRPCQRALLFVLIKILICAFFSGLLLRGEENGDILL